MKSPTSFHLEAELLDRLRVACAVRKVTQSDVIAGAIEEWLQRVSTTPPKDRGENPIGKGNESVILLRLGDRKIVELSGEDWEWLAGFLVRLGESVPRLAALVRQIENVRSASAVSPSESLSAAHRRLRNLEERTAQQLEQLRDAPIPASRPPEAARAPIDSHGSDASRRRKGNTGSSGKRG